MLILRFAERIIPEEVLNGIFVENHYHINRDCPQAFVVPAFIGFWNHIIVKDGVRYKQVYSSPKWEDSVMYLRTDVYPLLWVFYAFVVFLDKHNLKLKKVVYKFLLWTKQGKDFLPVGERVSGWREFFKFYLISLGGK